MKQHHNTVQVQVQRHSLRLVSLLPRDMVQVGPNKHMRRQTTKVEFIGPTCSHFPCSPCADALLLLLLLLPPISDGPLMISPSLDLLALPRSPHML